MGKQAAKRRSGEAQGRRGMTLIELLVVMGIILVLLSIVVVAVAAATKTAAGANTRALLGSIKQALVRFKEDMGYYPPVLGANPDVPPTTSRDLRGLVPPPDPEVLSPDDFDERFQAWYSITSLAEYLIGYGHHNEDGYGMIPPPVGPLYPTESPPYGIRHPGRDGVWGATYNGAADGLPDSRMGGTNPNMDTGKVLGPYLELKESYLLEPVTLAGQAPDPVNDPKMLMDYWGNPIRYYRRLYRSGALESNYRSYTAGIPTPTLSSIFALRPYEVGEGQGTDDLDFPDDDGDTTTMMALRGAEFALFSPGPDRGPNHNTIPRRRVSEGNRDNIVEIGP